MASHEHDESSLLDGENIAPATSLDPLPISIRLDCTYTKEPSHIHPQDVHLAADFSIKNPSANAKCSSFEQRSKPSDGEQHSQSQVSQGISERANKDRNGSDAGSEGYNSEGSAVSIRVPPSLRAANPTEFHERSRQHADHVKLTEDRINALEKALNDLLHKPPPSPSLSNVLRSPAGSHYFRSHVVSLAGNVQYSLSRLVTDSHGQVTLE